MGRFNSLELAVPFPSLITLCGCQDLVPRDTSSLFIPRFQRSEIFGFVAGLGATIAAVPDLVAMQASVQRWHQPEDGDNHGGLSDPMGLPRFVDCVATRNRMERDRSVDQFSERRRLPSLRPQNKRASNNVSLLCDH
jgi:hypothetical protein